MKMTIALLISLAVCGLTLPTDASAQSRAGDETRKGINVTPVTHAFPQLLYFIRTD